MGKKIFGLIFLLLIIYGIWSFVNILGVKIRYGKIKEQAKNIVKYTPGDSDLKIRRKIEDNAEESGLKLTDENIDITRYDDGISLTITYPDSAILPFGLKTFYYNQRISISKGDVE
ncbi:MAG: hypothetical protein B5M53_10015 [Candidatus Cloacimonas sp. 4484_209]|nr:MAG: hypothetical protein B5M53_10015 [Candidatus Cloacimonas sp. 4484_209]